MKTDRELMQQALDDLMSCSGAPHWPVFQPTITALRERLAQAEQEPVAWVADGVLMKIGIPEKYTGYLYTTPPAAQRQPLTDEQIQQLTENGSRLMRDYAIKLARAIEAAHGIAGEKK